MNNFKFLLQDYPEMYDLYVEIEEYRVEKPDFSLVKVRQFIEILFLSLNCKGTTIEKSFSLLNEKHNFDISSDFKASFQYLIDAFNKDDFWCPDSAFLNFDIILNKLLDISVWYCVEAKQGKYDYHIFPIEYQKIIFNYQLKQKKKEIVLKISCLGKNAIDIFDDDKIKDISNNIAKIDNEVNLLKEEIASFVEKEYSIIELEVLRQKGHGYFILEDYKNAYIIYLQLSMLGYAPAQLDLAEMFFEGVYIDKNERCGINWMLKAVNQGYRKAIDEIESMVVSNSCFEDISNIAKSLHRIALIGNAEDPFAVGFMHSNYWKLKMDKIDFNNANEEDIELAIYQDSLATLEWYKLSVYRGSIKAIENILNIYRDLKLEYYIMLWSLKSYKLNPDNNEYDFDCIDKVELNHDAKTYFDKFLNNVQINDSDKFNLLGEFYWTDIINKTDYKKAYLYFCKAAEKGNIDAYYNLAICYREGLGVEKNVSKENMWKDKAVKETVFAIKRNMNIK